jgi:uncharacterized protein
MHHDGYSDAYVGGILRGYHRFAVVGASLKPARASHSVTYFLLSKGYHVFPVNPGCAGETLLGQAVYARLGDIPGGVEVVDVFRNSEAALDIAREAVAIGAKALWMQIGVRNEEAARLAEAGGLRVVMNRCPKIEYERLWGAER